MDSRDNPFRDDSSFRTDFDTATVVPNPDEGDAVTDPRTGPVSVVLDDASPAVVVPSEVGIGSLADESSVGAPSPQPAPVVETQPVIVTSPEGSTNPVRQESELHTAPGPVIVEEKRYVQTIDDVYPYRDPEAPTNPPAPKDI